MLQDAKHTLTHTHIDDVDHSSLSFSLRDDTQAAIHHRLPLRMNDGLEREKVNDTDGEACWRVKQRGVVEREKAKENVFIVNQIM